MAIPQHNDPTQPIPASPANPTAPAPKPGAGARQVPHAAGSGSSTGDPGNPRGQGRAPTTKE